MKQLIKVEFYRNLRSFILWSVIIIGLSVLMLSLYPAFADSFDSMTDYLDMLPQGFLEVFGMGEGGLDMTTPYGWFGMEGYLFALLIGGSYAGILGSSILSKEEDDKTIEFLLSKPISRTKILLGKGIVVLINLTLLSVLLFVSLTITFSIIAEFDFITILLISVGLLILNIIFASLSMLISVFITKSRMVMSASLGLVIGAFFLQVIATVTDELHFLIYFTPYEYFDAVSIINDNSIKSVYLFISLGIVLASLFSTWFFYRKKDITV